ncbi:hypothetical protein ACHAW5_000057 [Stephanodiscus triporus]|uniref:HTH La-type RNA-binding domain-containing protein n=1 Tax=Stephanodiscus triporus TaxID=2934178 RepID=A0ABD3NNV3_9STRA
MTDETDEPIIAGVDKAADSAVVVPDGDLIASLAERLRFFFSNANLRQDRWMRDQLSKSDDGVCDGPLSLEMLLRFNTLKSITSDKSLLAAAAKSDELKGLISYDEEKEEVKRVSPFDFKTMGDGSKLSLYVKNVPVTEPLHEDEDGAEPKNEKVRPRYAVTRDEVKALFEGYGRVAIVQLRYGKKQHQQTENDKKCNAPSARGFKGGESYPLGVAIIEFEGMDGIEKACEDLLPKKDEEDGDKKDPLTVLEIKGNKLVVEKMRPSKFFKSQADKGSNKKRSRDDDPDDDNHDGEEKADEDPEDAKFEPITLDWETGCVIALAGLDAASCDRESIRDAVSEILGVTTDVKTSGLYVDYNRGATTGNLRLKSPKPEEMKELVSKLTDGSLLVANAKVESAKILEGEEEEKYYENFIAWLNTRKRMKDEEKRTSTNNNNHRNNHNNKRQKFGGRGGGRGRGGRGRDRR